MALSTSLSLLGSLLLFSMSSVASFTMRCIASSLNLLPLIHIFFVANRDERLVHSGETPGMETRDGAMRCAGALWQHQMLE